MALPLRKITQDGAPYQRRHAIEGKLDQLAELTHSELAAYCSVSDPKDKGHIPSECLLNLVRNCRSDNSDQQFEALFRALRLRVIARLPPPERGRDPDGKVILLQRNIQIAEAVMDRFQELLVRDRCSYEERLDYFEVNFDAAVAALRKDAQRRARRQEKRSVPMTHDDETSELNAEIEEAAARIPVCESKLDDPIYRSRLDAAIKSLPDDQRRVVELLVLGVPIDSENPETQTIVRMLGCVEKTVRNRRDRAYAALRKALKEENES